MAFKRVIIRRVGPLSWLLELMRKLFVLSLVCFLTLFTNVSKACLPLILEDQERIDGAKSIFIGQVTGIRNDYDENILRAASKPGQIVVQGGSGTYYTLRVFVTQTLKGKSKKILTTPICWCGCGSAKPNDIVVVFKYSDGSFYVSNDEEMIVSVKKILGK